MGDPEKTRRRRFRDWLRRRRREPLKPSPFGAWEAQSLARMLPPFVALLALPAALFGAMLALLPKLDEKFGAWAPLIIGLAMGGTIYLALYPYQRVTRRIARLEMEHMMWRDQTEEEAEKVATERAEAAGAQREAMVDELRALNCALAPRSRALRRSARPYH